MGFAQKTQKKSQTSRRTDTRLPTSDANLTLFTDASGVLEDINAILYRQLTQLPTSLWRELAREDLLYIGIQLWSPQDESVGKHVPAKHQVEVSEPHELRLVLEHGLYRIQILRRSGKDVDL